MLDVIVLRLSASSRGVLRLIHGNMLGSVHPMTSIGCGSFVRAGVNLEKGRKLGQISGRSVWILVDEIAHNRRGAGGYIVASDLPSLM